MPNTYTQVHIHCVFAVRRREGLIQKVWKDELYKYITGIFQHYEHKVLAIDGMPDHIHVLFGMRPTQSLSDLMQDVKGSSSKWINDRRYVKGWFEWQSGYGAFAVSKPKVKNVIRYIQDQEQHHNEKRFIEEYHEMLTVHGIEYDNRYTFQPVE